MTNLPQDSVTWSWQDRAVTGNLIFSNVMVVVVILCKIYSVEMCPPTLQV